MKRYLVDTNHLSPALCVKSSVRERILEERRRGSRFATCWPVLCELEAGLVQLVDAGRHRRMLKVLMREVRVWPMDWRLVQHYGTVAQKAKRIGRSMSSVDLTLAALALKENTTLLTADQDFQPFPEIRTENWIAGS